MCDIKMARAADSVAASPAKVFPACGRVRACYILPANVTPALLFDRPEQFCAFARRPGKSHIRTMSFLRPVLTGFALLLGAFFLPSAQAAAPQHVQAKLVAADASVQPGKPITVA